MNVHDWRVWWDPQIRKWKACRWDEKGGVITASKLVCSTRFETDGEYMRVKGEAKIGFANVLTNSHVDTEVLRLLPRSQFVQVPTIALIPKVESHELT
jgi:hypothetical protein